MTAQDCEVVSPGYPEDWTPWVYLKLVWREKTYQPTLALTITFGTHHTEYLGGQVWFGLHGGELILQPISGQFSGAALWPPNPLDVGVRIKRTLTDRKSSKDNKSAAVEASLVPLGATFCYGSGSEDAATKVIEDVFETIHWRIRAHGSPTKAIWTFEAEPATPCLEGHLQNELIARFGSDSEAGEVKATFSVYRKDIRILDSEGFWADIFCKAKIAVLRARIHKTIAKRMGPVVYTVILTTPITQPHHG